MNRLEKFLGSLKAAVARISAALGGRDRAKIILRVVLALVIIGLLRFLYEADKPWESGIAAAQAKGQSVKTEHCVVTGLWWAALFNVGVAAFLFAVSGWLSRPPGANFHETGRATPPIPWIPIVSAVLLASVITSIFTLPRLDHSLWFDEEYTVRCIVVGDFRRTDENGRMGLIGEVTPRPATWSETLWFFEMPNNHPFFSVCARLCHSLVQPELGPENPDAQYFSERALRAPAWLAGIGSLFTVALMLAWIGFPRAAIAAPLLLSIHPWFLRYASEARGYVFLFFLGPLLVYFLAQAISKGKWRWWIAYAVVQTLYIYSNASGIHLLVMLNLAGFVMPFLRPGTARADRWILVSRLFLVNAFSAMIFIQLIMPNVLGFSNRFRPHQNIELLINANMFRDMLSSYATGMRWHDWDPSNPYCVTTSRLLHDHPIALPFFFSLLVALAVLGVVALWKRGAFTRLLIPVFLLPAPLFVFEAYHKGIFIFYWYAIFILPFLWALVAMGIDWLSGRCGRSEARHTAAACVATAALGLFLGWLTTQQRSLLVSHPLEQSRESVESYRDVVNPYSPGFDDVISVGVWKYTRAYDPGHYHTKTFDDFKTILDLAEREKKPLYINHAMPQLARRGFPEIMALVDDPSVFRPVEVFWGLEPAATRYVHEYIPGSFHFEADTP